MQKNYTICDLPWAFILDAVTRKGFKLFTRSSALILTSSSLKFGEERHYLVDRKSNAVMIIPKANSSNH